MQFPLCYVSTMIMLFAYFRQVTYVAVREQNWTVGDLPSIERGNSAIYAGDICIECDKARYKSNLTNGK